LVPSTTNTATSPNSDILRAQGVHACYSVMRSAHYAREGRLAESICLTCAAPRPAGPCMPQTAPDLGTSELLCIVAAVKQGAGALCSRLCAMCCPTKSPCYLTRLLYERAINWVRTNAATCQNIDMRNAPGCVPDCTMHVPCSCIYEACVRPHALTLERAPHTCSSVPSCHDVVTFSGQQVSDHGQGLSLVQGNDVRAAR
jgi:hypothetical protein